MGGRIWGGKQAHPGPRSIAEDFELSRSLLKKLLEMRDYSVTAVTNGREVLDEMKRQTFDIILMDVHMPEMDGAAATAEIRRQEQAGPPVPIIAVTADAFWGLREHYLAKGFTEYLSKPIQAEALFALIDTLVTRQSQEPRGPTTM
jgi:CheY-like chemotaxis protein